MYKHFREPPAEDQCMTSELMDLVELRRKTMTNEWRDRFSFRFTYYLICPFGDWEAAEAAAEEEQAREEVHIYTTAKKNALWLNNLTYPPHIFLGTMKHAFNQQQLKLLTRGPTYVPPYRMHASPSSSIDDITRKQYAPLRHQLAWLSCKYSIVVRSQLLLLNDFYEHFKQVYSVALPAHFQDRAIYEKNLVADIYQSLKKNNLILRRTADNMNTFYLGYRPDFEQLADQYLASTTDYELIFTSDQTKYGPELMHQVAKACESIQHSLRVLRRRRDIDEESWQQIQTSIGTVHLSHLYFLPDVSKNNDVTLVPTITSSSSHMVYKLSQFLDQLLRPFAQKHMDSGVFQDEIEFLQQISQYASPAVGHGRLTPTTLFCTAKVLNYSALTTHEKMIDTVCRFIRENVAADYLDKIRIGTVKNLLQLCLCHTVFCYKNKLYKFLRGGPTRLPLMDTLANIYLFAWQRKILQETDSKKEFFGRYIDLWLSPDIRQCICSRYKDQLFFTWNHSKDDFDRFVQVITQKYPHIILQISIGSSVNYLHALVTNENGQLITRIYHNPNLPAYTLPYVIGHARVQYSNWLRTALIRAVCTCTSIEDFNRERVRIELTYFASGYSYRFMESHLAHFYTYFRVDTLRYDYNSAVYNRWREKCFDFINSQRARLSQLRHRQESNYFFRFHYLHDYGPRSKFNQLFYDLWLKHFHQHPVLGKEPMQVFIFTKHFPSLNALLTQ